MLGKFVGLNWIGLDWDCQLDKAKDRLDYWRDTAIDIRMHKDKGTEVCTGISFFTFSFLWWFGL